MISSLTLPEEFSSQFPVTGSPVLSNTPCTQREPYKYLATGGGNEYLIIYAQTDVQRYYLERSIVLRDVISQQFGSWFNLNELLWYGETDKGCMAVYLKINSLSQAACQNSIDSLLSYYETLPETLLTQDTRAQIIHDFLDAWPEKYHSAIRTLDEFSEFEKQLSLLESTKLCLEHGDYTPNNMGVASGSNYLFDFEFVKQGQPAGFDLYDLLSAAGELSSFEGDILNLSLNRSKYALVNRINEMVDSEKDGVIVFTSFSQSFCEAWATLWEKNPEASYNLHPDWCRIWFESFGEKYAPYLITCWNNGKLEGVFPLYVHRKHLCVIGTYPDLYDYAEPLYANKSILSKMIKYMVASGYDLDMRYLATEELFCRLLFKEIYSKNFFYLSKFIDLKPRIDFTNYKINKKLRYDARRCINRAEKERSELGLQTGSFS